MSRIKFTDLNIGDTFALHTIKFARKVNSSYIRGQIKYVRTQTHVKVEMDDLDELILKAIRTIYPQAKNSVSINTIEDKQKSKYKKSTLHLCSFTVNVHIVKQEHLSFGNLNAAYTTTEFSFPIAMFCERAYKKEFNDDLVTNVYKGDNYMQELKAIINSSLIEFEEFFS